MNKIEKLMHEHDNRCYYCGQKCVITNVSGHIPYRASRDHKTPKSRGGTNAAMNTTLSCAACNFAKDDMTAEEFFFFLIHHTYAESYTEHLVWKTKQRLGMK